MDFALSKEHLLLKDMLKNFVENEIKPLEPTIDEEERFPHEYLELFKKYGFMGIAYPKELGGQGADNLAYAMIMEELSKYSVTASVILAAHNSLACTPLYIAGTPEQKEKFLRPLLSGKKLGAFALTEAGAGSDSAMQQTKAYLDGDEWVLNGTKIFITNAGEADIYCVVAMTDKSLGNKGISMFVVEAGTPGFSIGKHEKKMGIKGSATCELIFENCRIPKDNLIGKVNEGFKIAMKTLDAGRVGVSAQGLGVAEGAIEVTKKYVQERKQFGKRLAQFQNTQFELADMQTRVDAGKLLVYRAAWMKDQGLNYGPYASMAKYYCAATGSDVTRRCLQLFGGYGFTRDYPIERMMRDAKIIEIYEGTSEMQKTVISRFMGVK